MIQTWRVANVDLGCFLPLAVWQNSTVAAAFGTPSDGKFSISLDNCMLSTRWYKSRLLVRSDQAHSIHCADMTVEGVRAFSESDSGEMLSVKLSFKPRRLEDSCSAMVFSCTKSAAEMFCDADIDDVDEEDVDDEWQGSKSADCDHNAVEQTKSDAKLCNTNSLIRCSTVDNGSR